MSLKNKFAVDRPFEETTIGVCLPGTWEMFMFCSALEAGGAKLLCCPFFCSPEVGIELLKNQRVKLLDTRHAAKCVRLSDFIHDTAGFLGKDLFNQKNSVKGIVEQTGSGIKFYEKKEAQRILDKPVLNLDSSYVKRKRENQMATGLGLIEALLKLHVFLPGKKVLVIGFGNIGVGCATYLKNIQCDVAVFDVDTSKRAEALSLGFGVDEMKDLIPQADIIVNATGSSAPVLKKEDLKNLKNHAVLANMGGVGWDREYLLSKPVQKVGRGILKVQLNSEKAVYEMAGGSLVNFALASGTDTETMDMVFSLGALGMQYLVKNYRTMPKGLLPIPDDVQKEHLQLVAKISARKVAPKDKEE